MKTEGQRIYKTGPCSSWRTILLSLHGRELFVGDLWGPNLYSNLRIHNLRQLSEMHSVRDDKIFKSSLMFVFKEPRVSIYQSLGYWRRANEQAREIGKVFLNNSDKGPFFDIFSLPRFLSHFSRKLPPSALLFC